MTSYYDKIQDLKRQRQSHDRGFERWQDVALGEVFSVGGSEDVSFKPGYVWVHEWGMAESPAQAFKGSVIVQAGDWVKMKRNPKDPHLWQIIDYWAGGLDTGDYNLVIRHLTILHGLNHQYPSESDPGIDKVLVWPPAWQPFKTTGDGSSLTITTQPGVYFYNNSVFRVFNGATLDLTSNVPAAGLARRVLIYVVESTKVLTALNGTTVPDAGAIPVPYPNAPSGCRPSAYVTLVGGQTAITTATDIVDARDMHALGGSSSGVSGPGSSTDEAIARWNGTGGSTLQDSGITIDDSDVMTFPDSELVRPVHRDYGLALNTQATASGATNIDLESGNVHDVTMTGDVTLSFINAPASGVSGSFTLFLRQDGTGGRTVTWPANIYWSSGNVPGLTTAALAVDVISFVTLDGGSSWHGFPAGINMLIVSGSSLAISVGDDIDVSDAAYFDALSVNVSDDINVSDEIAIGSAYIDLEDDATVSDSVTVSIVLPVNVQDDIEASDVAGPYIV